MQILGPHLQHLKNQIWNETSEIALSNQHPT